jgi:hypothetical protein
MSECQHGRQVTSGERCEECYAEQRIRLAPLLESLPRWRPQPPLLVEKGDPKPWVGVSWDHFGTVVEVRCSHCGARDMAYAPYVRADPEWLKRTVETHNAHVTSPADDNAAWQPGTP